MKYESPITCHSNDMANVKVFCRQTNRWTGQKLYAPDLLIRGHKNWRNRTFGDPYIQLEINYACRLYT
jgi:hypothetical protein